MMRASARKKMTEQNTNAKHLNEKEKGCRFEMQRE